MKRVIASALLAFTLSAQTITLPFVWNPVTTYIDGTPIVGVVKYAFYSSPNASLTSPTTLATNITTTNYMATLNFTGTTNVYYFVTAYVIPGIESVPSTSYRMSTLRPSSPGGFILISP